jgi:hypothetical protein
LPPAPAAPPAAPRQPHTSIFPAIAGDLGALPKPAFGLSLGSALFLDPVRLEGYGAYFFQQPARSSSLAGAGGDIRLALGGIRACYAGLRGTFDLAACAGFEIGALHGEGFGVLLTRAPDSLWLAGTLGLRVSLELAPPLRLAADVGMALPLRRDQFVLDGVGLVHQASAVVGRALFGPELRF